MRIRVAVIAVAGLAVALYLVLKVGAGSVLSAASATGWLGFGILCVYALGLFLILGSAWYAVLPGRSAAQWRVTTWSRMVRDAATEILPFSHLGGIVLGAHAAIRRGIAQPLTFASMIVDVTCEMLAQVVYIAIGVIILRFHAPTVLHSATLAQNMALELGCVAVAVGLALGLQHYGREIAQKVASRMFPQAAAASAAVADLLQRIYNQPARVGLCVLIHLCGWLVSAGGTWVAFRLMAVHIDLAAVLALESLVNAARSIAFIIPNAIGVQEAAYALLVPLLGVGEEYGLAVSVLKRARDIAVGVPILLIWQASESRRALRSAASPG